MEQGKSTYTMEIIDKIPTAEEMKGMEQMSDEKVRELMKGATISFIEGDNSQTTFPYQLNDESEGRVKLSIDSFGHKFKGGKLDGVSYNVHSTITRVNLPTFEKVGKEIETKEEKVVVEKKEAAGEKSDQ